jgi:hypothetical protein
MEPAIFDVEISISHAVELRKANRKKFDRLIARLHSGLLDFPGVGCTVGPETEATPDEIKEWDSIKREGEARRKQETKEALGRVLKDPEMQEIIKSQVKKAFASPENREKLALAVARMGSA